MQSKMLLQHPEMFIALHIMHCYQRKVAAR
jgi:hypothetical protein